MLGGGAGGLLAVTLLIFCSFPNALRTETFGESICRAGLDFWDANLGRCLPCAKCAPDFTLRPCAVHQNAICGPLSALELDWSFLATRKSQESLDEEEEENVQEVRSGGSKVIWRFPGIEEDDERSESGNDRVEKKSTGRRSSQGRLEDEHRVTEGSEQLRDNFESSEEDTRNYSHERRKTSEDDNNIPWDWQTGALVLAVCACIVFFVVAGCSALVYARQWRRMKRNFEPAGLEEISARLNLMVKAELAELTAGAPMSPGDPETRCQYLEKLLDRKRETPVVAGWRDVDDEGDADEVGGRGNLYIEEVPGTPRLGIVNGRNVVNGVVGSTPRTRRSQIAQIHRNIESILGQKANHRC